MRWKKIEEIFTVACALPTVKRIVYLNELCRQDNDLYKEIIDLLENDEMPHELLDSPIKKGDLANVFNFDEMLLADVK